MGFLRAQGAEGHGLRRALEAPLRQLKARREKVRELLRAVDAELTRTRSCDHLRRAKHENWNSRGLTPAHMETLAVVLEADGLPRLRHLDLGRNSLGDDGMQWTSGLHRQSLQTLHSLIFFFAPRSYVVRRNRRQPEEGGQKTTNNTISA